MEYIADRVGKLLDIPAEDVWSPGRYGNLAAARGLICFWAARAGNEHDLHCAPVQDLDRGREQVCKKRSGNRQKGRVSADLS